MHIPVRVARALYTSLHSFCRTTGVYVRVILKIIVSDLLKFIVIFVVVLYIFVGSFYLSLRAGVTVNMSNGVTTSDLERFRLDTL